MRTLQEMLRSRVASTPDRVSLVFPSAGGTETVLDYRQLHGRAEAIAAMLRVRVGRGERALLVYPTGPEFVAAFFGCLAAGVIAVPVPPPAPGPMKERFAHVMADCAPAVTLSTADWSKIFGFDPSGCVATDTEVAAGDGADAAATVPARPDDIAYLQYSSGTTGMPRGVIVTHANAMANCAMIESMFTPEEHEKTVGWMPHFHDFGLVSQILIAVFENRTNVMLDPLDFVRNPEYWLRQVTKHRAQYMPMPAFAVDIVLRRIPPERRAQFDLSRVRGGGIGAETLSHDDLQAFADGFAVAGLNPIALMPSYGMAEAVALVASSRPGRRWTTVWVSRERLSAGVVVPGSGDLALVGSGVPVPGVVIRIVDPHTRAERPAGHTGEILVAGANISRGYWGRPDPSVILDGVRYLPTGDVGALVNDELFVLDRLAHLITIDGRDHYPFALERTALGVNAGVPLRRAVAFGVDDAVVLVVEVDGADVPEPGSAAAAAITAAVSARHGVTVREVELIAKGGISTTTSSKARRTVCRDRYLASRSERSVLELA